MDSGDVIVSVVTILTAAWGVQRVIRNREVQHATRTAFVKLHSDLRALQRAYYENESHSNTHESLINTQPSDLRRSTTSRSPYQPQQHERTIEDWTERWKKHANEGPVVLEHLRIATTAIEGDLLMLEMLGCVYVPLNEAAKNLIDACNIFDQGKVPDFKEYRDIKIKELVAVTEQRIRETWKKRFAKDGTPATWGVA